MKKLILSLLSIVLFVCYSFAQSADCAKFRNGVFTTKSAVSGMITISRHGNLQTERTAKGVVMVFTVNWVSNCTYTLKPTPQTINKYHIPSNALLTVTITQPKKRSYYQVTSSNLSARKAASLVMKVAN